MTNCCEETAFRWVRGNTLHLSVPLQTVTTVDGEEQREDYIPPEDSQVSVFIRGGYLGRKEYEYTIEGNVVSFTDDGTLTVGTYGIEIIVKEEGRNLRTFKCREIEIVNCSDELGELPDGQVLLDAAIFVQGEKGDKGDPGEGVPEGGTAGQILCKASDDDYDTEWIDNQPFETMTEEEVEEMMERILS